MKNTSTSKKNTLHLNQFNLLNANTTYIKQEVINKSVVWSIYDLDGQKLAQAGNKNTALEIIAKNDLIALSVH